MFTNHSVHFNPQYRSSNISSIPQLVKSVNERQLPLSSVRSLKRCLKPYENPGVTSPRPLSSSNSAVIRSYGGIRKSKYSIVKTNAVNSPRKNVYKWENKETKSKLLNSSTVPESRRVQSPSTGGNGYRKITLSHIVENVAKNHYRSSTPFYSLISKGWFSAPPCGVTCINSTSFDLQSCCFISNKFLPINTLSLNTFQESAPSNKVERKKADIENLPSFVKLSKHQLIRKPPQPQLLKADSSVVLCTKRKLIREIVPADSVRNQTALPSTDVIKQQDVIKSKNSLPLASADQFSHHFKKKRADLSPLLVLTSRKLVRRPESDCDSNVQKASITNNPTKLIHVNRNKLIRSSLLQKYPKRSAQNYSHSAQSVLSQIIQFRRRPYAGSSYVLLTRNKLVRSVRHKNKVWKKHADIHPPKSVAKKSGVLPKVFVSVGKNKLIRKSLFSKTNKISSPKSNSVSSISPLKNKLLTLMLDSPGRRIQRFTNHLSRRKLKYLAISSSRISRNRFSNKCKNNKRILRTKNSIVCPTFRRKGECQKKVDDNCSFLHDKKYIMICKSYIKGACENENCLLSHDLIPQKAPVCLHFLNGNCESAQCPFLHTKLEPNAQICIQFLRGFCEAADKCTSWHVYACPQYKSSAKCDKGDRCRLPHRDLEYFEGKCAELSDGDDENVIEWRYFEKNKLDEKDPSGVQIIPERHSLGILPDYIPL